jgi:hypothetical protein
MNNLTSLLLNSRTQAHIFHFRTKNYSKHKALENYYTSIVPLLDTYTEAYQGKYGIIGNYRNQKFIENPSKAIDYFKKLLVKIQKLKIVDSYLRNIVDQICELIYKTIYMLTYLA